MVSRNSKKTKCPSCKSESTLRNSRARSTKERIIKAITWLNYIDVKSAAGEAGGKHYS